MRDVINYATFRGEKQCPLQLPAIWGQPLRDSPGQHRVCPGFHKPLIIKPISQYGY